MDRDVKTSLTSVCRPRRSEKVIDYSARLSSGFTLVELLVVVAIIAMMFSLIAGAVGHAKETAMRTGCGGNLRSMGTALHVYAGMNHNELPVRPRVSKASATLKSWTPLDRPAAYFMDSSCFTVLMESGLQIRQVLCPGNPKWAIECSLAYLDNNFASQPIQINYFYYGRTELQEQAPWAPVKRYDIYEGPLDINRPAGTGVKPSIVHIKADEAANMPLVSDATYISPFSEEDMTGFSWANHPVGQAQAFSNALRMDGAVTSNLVRQAETPFLQHNVAGSWYIFYR